MNAKTVGLYLFSAGYLLAVLFMKPRESPIYRFLTALVIANASFFLFQTESHDRYAFPLIIFLLLWAVFWIRKNSFRVFIVLYSLFSILYFYNLHTALAFNYPNNGLPILSSFIQPNLTISVSFLLTGLFFLFLWAIRRDGALWTFLIPPTLVILALVAKNMPLITHTPVSLTAMTPISASQDYGAQQINMPVNAYSGFDKWGSLSIQYAFYRHGIGTHANSTQTFDIGRHFTKFSFDYGIDTEAGPKGTVIFEVIGDDKKLFTSEKIGRYDLPRHADVDITGVKTLKLVVTDAGDGITDDHADWLNPKLSP